MFFDAECLIEKGLIQAFVAETNFNTGCSKIRTLSQKLATSAKDMRGLIDNPTALVGCSHGGRSSSVGTCVRRPSARVVEKHCRV